MRAVVVLFLLGLTCGCESVGPGSVRRDRLHYSTAVSDSWMEQLLLNIVRTRYGAPPAFLEVASVVSGYTVESRVNAGAEWQPTNPEDFLAIGGSRTFTDRPTISYTPMTGEKYARSLLSPVPLEALAYVLGGAELVTLPMEVMVQSIEGQQSLVLNPSGELANGASFGRVMATLGGLFRAHVVEIETARRADDVEFWIRLHVPADATPEVRDQVAELRRLLGLPAGLDRVRLIFGTWSEDAGVVAVRTRSLMQILVCLGSGVHVPEPHVLDRRAAPAAPAGAPGGFTVRCSREEPKDPYVAVPYEGQWFWVDRHDLASKTVLTVVTVLFNYLDSGVSKGTPVMTVPVH